MTPKNVTVSALKVIDEKTDVLADKAVDSVKKSVSSFWRFASGYAQQVGASVSKVKNKMFY